jgi:hypothetical protein
MGVSIRMYVQERLRECVNWNYLVQDRDKFWAVFTKVMKI